MGNSNPLVSICCLTYNHEPYIRQCLDGFMMQKTDFSFEVLIHDDASTDGTTNIIKEYEAKYPNIIKPIYQTENQYSKGVSPSIIQYFCAIGKYIAPCEGDDYWTDPYKLQKQVDFLERNLDFVGCFHNTEERYEEPDQASFLYCNFNNQIISFQDLSYRNLIPTCSVVYRRVPFMEFPEWYKQLKVKDWTLHLLNAQFGNFWYIPKIMGVHRLHKSSTWALQDHQKNVKYIEHVYNIMINEGFGNNTKVKEFLINGKKEFVNSHLQILDKSQETSIKKRIKKKLIGIINRL